VRQERSGLRVPHKRSLDDSRGENEVLFVAWVVAGSERGGRSRSCKDDRALEFESVAHMSLSL
jgi:hypothetical protein